MKSLLLGGAGFIGTNLALKLAEVKNNVVTIVDKDLAYFNEIKKFNYSNIKYVESDFSEKTDFKRLLEGQDIVYHLISSTVPTTSNLHIAQEIEANVVVTSYMLEACVACNVKRVVFISSGGTVYGINAACPLNEDMPTEPISSYGIQKITIEKLLYLYNYMYNLDYRIVRLANPYGPFQRPNGILGAVTTFTNKVLRGETIIVYGDGSVVRDFIYIDDAISAMLKIANEDCRYKIYNVGSGYGTSISDLLYTIEKSLNMKVNVEYREARKVDVPVNYLDVSRYEKEFGKIDSVTLQEGINRTANFLKNKMD